MVIVVMVVIAVIVAVMIAIPPVIVLEPAATTVPITREEPLAIMMRRYPYGAGIRWAGPIPVMPPVVSANRIPVALNPIVIWTGAGRLHCDHARGRGSADTDADREIGRQGGSNRHENQ